MTIAQNAYRPENSLDISLTSLDSVFDLMATALVVLNHELVITHLNSSAENILDISKDKAIGLSLEGQVFYSKELALLCKKAIDNQMAYRTREISIKTKNKHALLSCFVTPFSDQGFEKPSILLELQDVRRDRIIQREEELANQRKLSRTIIQQLAHEVKNPLGGLRGAAQLLERKLPSSDLKKYTSVIIDEADRLVYLVDRTLGTGKIPSKERLNLHEISEYVIAIINNEKKPLVQIVKDYDPSIPSVYVDKDQIIQAALNIVKNSLYAVSKEGKIVFRTRTLRNYTLGGIKHKLVIKLEIEDNGPGISEEMQPTIFYPLVTSKATGTGLGLTIAQDLISRNEGLIEFSSEPGLTSFSIILPMCAAEEEGSI
jgi:two-component system nitrogen regulation sensor histidine kinase GlnL